MASVDFVIKLRDALQLAVQACQEYIESCIPKEWKTIEAKAPLNPEDPALKWLAKKLEQIKQSHPVLSYEFVKSSDGKVVALKYSVLDEEAAADVESPTLWAFSKASCRPQT